MEKIAINAILGIYSILRQNMTKKITIFCQQDAIRKHNSWWQSIDQNNMHLITLVLLPEARISFFKSWQQCPTLSPSHTPSWKNKQSKQKLPRVFICPFIHSSLSSRALIIPRFQSTVIIIIALVFSAIFAATLSLILEFFFFLMLHRIVCLKFHAKRTNTHITYTIST